MIKSVLVKSHYRRKPSNPHTKIKNKLIDLNRCTHYYAINKRCRLNIYEYGHQKFCMKHQPPTIVIDQDPSFMHVEGCNIYVLN